MKDFRTLGLATVAAALMAIVGAGSASATVLCTTAPTKGICPGGFAYTGEIHAVSVEKPTLTTTFQTIECSESTVRLSSETEGDATSTVGGLVEILTFTECNCTFFVVIKKGVLEIHSISGSTNGTLTSEGMTITAQCNSLFGKVHCIYRTVFADLGTLTSTGTTGGTAAIDTTVETERESTNGLCDQEAVWHVKYKITTPDTLYVADST